MTTATCQRPGHASPITLPQLSERPAEAVGPRGMGAVKMLRVSVTDACNLRCVYCMPEEGMEWLPKSSILSFEEIAEVTRVAAGLGVTHVKLTGGEPTARRDLAVLVGMLKKIEGIQDISLTSNGVLLGSMLAALKAAGLSRVTISMDSLKRERFAEITRRDEFARVWSTFESALAMGFERVKLNVVAMRGMNEDEIADFAGLTKQYPVTVRFIEFMPLGRSKLTDAPTASLLSEEEMRGRIEAAHGELLAIERSREAGVGPAKLFQLKDAIGRIGFISAMSHPFCETCNRLRLTPEGLLRSCLFDGGEVDLKPMLRNRQLGGMTLDEAFHACVAMKPVTHSDRGNKAMSRIGG